MADRTFSSAYGYDKAAPVFNFIKDTVWRPMTAADLAGGGGGGGGGSTITGDIYLSGVYVNTDDLERLASGQIQLLQAITGYQAPSQKYSFYIRSSGQDMTISQQVHSITYSNVGTGVAYIKMSAGNRPLEQYETVSFDFGKDYTLAPGFISSGTILVVNGTSSNPAVSAL